MIVVCNDRVRDIFSASDMLLLSLRRLHETISALETPIGSRPLYVDAFVFKL